MGIATNNGRNGGEKNKKRNRANKKWNEQRRVLSSLPICDGNTGC